MLAAASVSLPPPLGPADGVPDSSVRVDEGGKTVDCWNEVVGAFEGLEEGEPPVPDVSDAHSELDAGSEEEE